MHLFAITRGVKQHVDHMITQMQGKVCPMKVDGLDMFVELSVRPIQLWELVFPETELGCILGSLSGKGKGAQKLPSYKRDILRLALGIDKVPEVEIPIGLHPISHQNVAIEFIGIKKDVRDERGNELL